MKSLQNWLNERGANLQESTQEEEIDDGLLESQLEQLCVRVHGLIADCPTHQKDKLLNKFIETLKASRSA